MGSCAAPGRELGRELEALRLAARERVRALADLHVADAQVGQRGEGTRDLREVREDLRRVRRGQVQHVADRQPGEAHLERRRLEPRAAARLAGRDDVRKKRHLGDDRSLAFARRAAAAAHLAGPGGLRRGRVEREARGRVAARLRLGKRGEELAHLVPDAEERRRDRARRAADGRLVDRERALDDLVPLQARVLSGRRARRGRARAGAPGRRRDARASTCPSR